MPDTIPADRIREASADYQALLTQVGREVDGGWITQAHVVDTAEPRVAWCGLGSGFVRECGGGHSWWTPIGCGSPWCLHCQGFRADLRASALYADVSALGAAVRAFSQLRGVSGHEGRSAPVGRLVLTLHPDHWYTGSTSKGAGQLVGNAAKALVRALGVDRRRLAIVGTFHPTSSRHPWRSFPHVEVYWMHATFDADEVRALPWVDRRRGHLLDLDRMREEWGQRYAGSVNLEASWFGWHRGRGGGRYEERSAGRVRTLRGSMRYSLRPFTEDVWHALAERPIPSLWVVNGDRYVCEPVVRGSTRDGRADPVEVAEGLGRPGGVTLWPGFHRVRRYGVLCCRGFKTRLAQLEEALGELSEQQGFDGCTCPTCSEPLEVSMDEGRTCLIHHRAQAAEFDLCSGVLADGTTWTGVEP